MVVLDGASTGIGAIWYRMKLVPEEAESWYQMNAKVVLDDMECGYHMTWSMGIR
jgi:hypothetical protein